MLRGLLLALALAVSAVWLPSSMADEGGGVPPGIAAVPVHVQGESLSLAIQYFKPRGTGPFPVVLYLHGRGVNRAERANMRLAAPPQHVRWWLEQGVAVVAPVRVGYGATGGPDIEDTGARWQGAQCSGEPQFAKVAWAARDSAVLAHQWLEQQPWADMGRILVEGWSFGGLASAAVAGQALKGVRGIVNFSGGTTGNPIDAPGHSCRPDLLAEAYRELGRHARVPSLWLYAQNDGYWGAEAPRQWHAAYREGGSDTTLVMTGPVPGADGHELITGAPQLWSGAVAAFTRRIGFMPSPGGAAAATPPTATAPPRS